MIKDKFCFVYVTVENFEQAEFIAELAIKDKLIACANIFPESHSMFEWKGEVKLEKETVLLLKTLDNKYDLLEKLIIKNHVYETPCILKIDVSKGHKDFLKWVETSVSLSD